MRDTSQDKHGEQEFWDKVARQRIYAAFDNNEYIDVFDRTLGRDLTGLTVVDVGCASGVSAGLLAARGARVKGLDISPELVAQAARLWPEYGERLEFSVGDAENLDMADNSVDACFFGGVLHHFPDMRAVMAESLRVLRPGGRFIALEPNLLDFMERIEWAVAGWRGKLSPNEFPIDPRRMREQLLSAGFGKVRFWTTRHDIPVLNQFWGLKHLFSRKKGFWFKRPALGFVNLFRDRDHSGTFFVIDAVKGGAA